MSLCLFLASIFGMVFCSVRCKIPQNTQKTKSHLSSEVMVNHWTLATPTLMLFAKSALRLSRDWTAQMFCGQQPPVKYTIYSAYSLDLAKQGSNCLTLKTRIWMGQLMHLYAGPFLTNSLNQSKQNWRGRNTIHLRHSGGGGVSKKSISSSKCFAFILLDQVNTDK